MPRTTTARADAIRTAARLFDRQGYHGTGLAQVIAESGAPRGSFYFHFPGGKEELGVEAIRASSAQVETLLVRSSERSRDAADLVRRIGRGLERWLQESGFKEGCAVASLAADAATSSETLREACEQAYTSWRALLTDALDDHGVPPARSRDLATLIIAAFEGATLLARAERRTTPVRSVVRTLGSVI